MTKIMPNNLKRGFDKYQEEFEQKALEVLRSGWYILGNEVKEFEKEFAAYVGSKHCVGLASGLDALWIAFRVLGIGPGDEVLVQGNTYIASVMGITMNGATPIFVEPDEYFNIDTKKLEEKITDKTKAILVVHLYGQASKMDDVAALCKKYNLRLVEDCAQSHGACFDGKMTGTFGDIGCFSFYPSKNVGAFGDAGAIVTNDDKIAEDFRVFRNYGSEKRYYNKIVGANSRLDELQAAFLGIKLKYLEQWNEERRQIAKRYSDEIRNPKVILPPACESEKENVFHIYPVLVEGREGFRDYLKEKGVATLVHYPIPIMQQQAYAELADRADLYPVTCRICAQEVSLPLYPGMTNEQIDWVIACVNGYK